jgi:predicted nucleotidyltransferase
MVQVVSVGRFWEISCSSWLMLTSVQKRCSDTESELLAVYATGLSLHLPVNGASSSAEYLAVFMPPALLTCTDRLSRTAFDGALPPEFPQSITSKTFWNIAALIETNPNKLPVKVDLEDEQKCTVRYVEVKEFVRLAIGGTCDIIDVVRVAVQSVDGEFKEGQGSPAVYESEKWKLLVSSVFKPFVNDFLNLQWVRRTFGFASGQVKSLKFGARAEDSVRQKLFAMTYHRFFNVFEFLDSGNWIIQRKLAVDPSINSQQFLSSLNSFDDWAKSVSSAKSPIAELLSDIQEGKFTQEVLFETLDKSTQSVDDLLKKVQKNKKDLEPKLKDLAKNKTVPKDFGERFDVWLKQSRPKLSPRNDWSLEDDVKQITACPDNVSEILKTLNCPIQPSQVMFLTQSGSYLYDLQTKSSDTDYMVIFSHFPSSLDLTSTPAPDLYEDHVTTYVADKSNVIEYSANEIDNFCLMIMKGNPRNLEPLYASESKITYESVLWKKFKSFRDSLLSLRVYNQYLGFVSDRISKAKKEYDREDYVRSAKYLYHAYHKLYDVMRLADGKTPKVTLDGEEKEKIMEIRTVCSCADATPEFLKSFLENHITESNSLLETTAKRISSTELPQEADFDKLFEFLSFVRFVYQTLDVSQ